MPNPLVPKLPMMFVQYDEFVREIRRFDPFAFLCKANRLANQIDQRSLPDCLVDVPEIRRYRVAHGSEVYMEQSALAFLCKQVILHGNDHRHEDVTRDVMRCLFYQHVELMEPPVKEGDKSAGVILRTYGSTGIKAHCRGSSLVQSSCWLRETEPSIRGRGRLTWTKFGQNWPVD
jgi:hypothetical protein